MLCLHMFAFLSLKPNAYLSKLTLQQPITKSRGLAGSETTAQDTHTEAAGKRPADDVHVQKVLHNVCVFVLFRKGRAWAIRAWPGIEKWLPLFATGD